MALPLRGRLGGDTRSAAGYATTNPRYDDPRAAEQSWPYRTLTDLESADENPAVVSDCEKIEKLTKPKIAGNQIPKADRGRFVGGATRGLTGIMSGVDPMEILEMYIREAVGIMPVRSQKYKARANNPIGTGGQTQTGKMGARGIVSRSGNRSGSKQGWFSPPAPKDSDPSMFDPAYNLKDIATKGVDASVRHANWEKDRQRIKNKRIVDK